MVQKTAGNCLTKSCALPEKFCYSSPNSTAGNTMVIKSNCFICPKSSERNHSVNLALFQNNSLLHSGFAALNLYKIQALRGPQILVIQAIPCHFVVAGC